MTPEPSRSVMDKDGAAPVARVHRATAPDPALALEAKIAFLARPESYPEPTSAVIPVETHMSWVFLTDHHAYKLKKPVRTPYVDFRSVTARSRNCAAEVRLNRRLSSGIYLGTAALLQDGAGRLTFAKEGEVVDWLVKMRRLPAERMLDRLIRDRAVRDTDVDDLVRRLCEFYRQSRSCAISPAAYRREFEGGIEDSRRELRRPEHALPPDPIERVCARLHAVLSRTTLFDARVAAGRIVEGHGDLRPEHICLQGEPQIIDCLEFSRRLRTQDPLDELGFLALECERLGATRIGTAILDAYRKRSGDAAPAALLHFYQGYRACVRAMLAIRHLHEPAPQDRAQWTARTEKYLELARTHAACCK
jgi:aminoglycoside phosphotransferase family enzyme